MDWPRHEWQFSPDDIRVFEFEGAPREAFGTRVQTNGVTSENRDDEKPKFIAPNKCTVVRMGLKDDRHQVWELGTDAQWRDWLQEGHMRPLGRSDGGLVTLLCTRKEDRGVDSLPFLEDTFKRISAKFLVHHSVARSVNRNYSEAAGFSRALLKVPGRQNLDAVVYNCRSSGSWPGDMALSVTHIPKDGMTYGIFYGLSPETMKKISFRVQNSEDSFCHPMLLVGLFAEVEFRRVLELVKNGNHNLLTTVNELHHDGYRWTKPSKPRKGRCASQTNEMDADDSESPVDPWLYIYHMRNGLEHWKRQLAKMVSHIDELESRYYRASERPSQHGQSLTQDPEVIGSWERDEEIKQRQRVAGQRIKYRLEEIACDYDHLIKDCSKNIDGLSVATTLVLARDNMEISGQTRQDGSQMKSIAFLTMVFLPATFTATIFSMGFFKFEFDQLWIYFVVSVPLTAVVVAAWWALVIRKENKELDGRSRASDLEMQRKPDMPLLRKNTPFWSHPLTFGRRF